MSDETLDVIVETKSSASAESVSPTQLTHAETSQSQGAPQPGSTIPTQPTASASREVIPAGEPIQSTSTQPVVSTSRGPKTSTSESDMSESEGPKKKKRKKEEKKAATEDTSQQDVKAESHKSPDPSDIIISVSDDSGDIIWGDIEDSRTSKGKRNEGESDKEPTTIVPPDKSETQKQEHAGQSLEIPSAAVPRPITSAPRRSTTSSSEAYMSELEGAEEKKRKKEKKKSTGDTLQQHVETESRKSSDRPPYETKSSASAESVSPTQLTHAETSQSQGAPQPGSTIPTQPTASASREVIPAGEPIQSTSTQPVVSTSRGPMTSTSESDMSESEGPKKKKRKKEKKKATTEDTSQQDVKAESHKSPDPSDIIISVSDDSGDIIWGDIEDSRTSKGKRNEGESDKEATTIVPPTIVPPDKSETQKQEHAGQSLEIPSAAVPRPITSVPRRSTTSSSEAYMSELEGAEEKKRKKEKKKSTSDTSQQHVETESRKSSDLSSHESSKQQQSKSSDLLPYETSKLSPIQKRERREQKQIRPEPEAHSSSDPRYISEPERHRSQFVPAEPLSPDLHFRRVQEQKKIRRERREKRKAGILHAEPMQSTSMQPVVSTSRGPMTSTSESDMSESEGPKKKKRKEGKKKAATEDTSQQDVKPESHKSPDPSHIIIPDSDDSCEITMAGVMLPVTDPSSDVIFVSLMFPVSGYSRDIIRGGTEDSRTSKGKRNEGESDKETATVVPPDKSETQRQEHAGQSLEIPSAAVPRPITSAPRRSTTSSSEAYMSELEGAKEKKRKKEKKKSTGDTSQQHVETESRKSSDLPSHESSKQQQSKSSDPPPYETKSSASAESVSPTQLTHAETSQSQGAPQPGSTIPTQPTASASREVIPAGEPIQSTSTQPVVSTSRGPKTSTSESDMSESEGPKKKKRKKEEKKAATEDTSQQDVKAESHKSPDPSDIIISVSDDSGDIIWGDIEDSRTSKGKRNEGESDKEATTIVPPDKSETQKQEHAGQSLEIPSAAVPRPITSAPRRSTTSSSEAYMSELEGAKEKKRKKENKKSTGDTSQQHVETESRKSSDLPSHESSKQQQSKSSDRPPYEIKSSASAESVSPTQLTHAETSQSQGAPQPGSIIPTQPTASASREVIPAGEPIQSTSTQSVVSTSRGPIEPEAHSSSDPRYMAEGELSPAARRIIEGFTLQREQKQELKKKRKQDAEKLSYSVGLVRGPLVIRRRKLTRDQRRALKERVRKMMRHMPLCYQRRDDPSMTHTISDSDSEELSEEEEAN